MGALIITLALPIGTFRYGGSSWLDLTESTAMFHGRMEMNHTCFVGRRDLYWYTPNLQCVSQQRTVVNSYNNQGWL